MNDLQIFNFQSNEVRVVMKDGEPWWVAKDVCETFGDSHYRRSAARLDDDEKGVTRIDTPGGAQQMTVVNEPGLYSLLFHMQPQQSNLEKEFVAERVDKLKAFKRWITHEVIPTIRKHGMYATSDKLEEMLADPDTLIVTLQALKAEREKRKALEEKVAADAPLVQFANTVQCSDDTILVGELAKLMKQNGREIGRTRLFAIMREDGYLIKQQGKSFNMPTQRSMEMGLMEIRETAVIHSDGATQIHLTPRITAKGQVYFLNKYLETAGI